MSCWNSINICDQWVSTYNRYRLLLYDEDDCACCLWGPVKVSAVKFVWSSGRGGGGRRRLWCWGGGAWQHNLYFVVWLHFGRLDAGGGADSGNKTGTRRWFGKPGEEGEKGSRLLSSVVRPLLYQTTCGTIVLFVIELWYLSVWIRISRLFDMDWIYRSKVSICRRINMFVKTIQSAIPAIRFH